MTPQRTPGARRTVKACAAAALGLSLTLSSGLPAFAQTINGSAVEDALGNGSAGSGQNSALTPEVAGASGKIAVYVQFKGKGAFESTQPRSASSAGGRTENKAAQTQAIASAVESQSQQVAVQSGSTVLYTTHNALRGAAIQGDADQIKKLAERSDVAKISKIVPKKRTNSGTDVDTGALKEWTGTGQTGKDVTIAVIDTGLDYTHADFGGPGTKEAYAKAKASKELPAKDSGLYDSKKFVGGWDLAGDSYNPQIDEDSAQIPQPDSNPLDCSSGSGHGTHVAGTAAGYGVGADGKTWKGDYTKLTADQVKDMRIGPGSAPEAKVTSLRVFGCEGTTNLVGAALDRTLDPNGDGNFDDRANIASISIGADFGPSDDPENDIVNALSRAGVLSVIAAGNAGDSYNVYGNPGSAESALTIANSQGSTAGTDQVEVTGPSDLKGKYAASYSGNFNYPAADPKVLSGTVTTVPESNKYGCQAFTGQDFKGKWVYLDWADDKTGQFPCGSKVRFDNAAKAGAKGVVLTSDVELEDSGIAGNATIPGFRFPKSVVDKVKSAAEAGTLSVRMGQDLIGAGRIDSGSLDVINSSSSRGEHGSNGYTKPDVAAPGTSIISAGVGSGNGSKEMTGTSMATPHTSGIAALVLQKHPDWTPQSIKAAIMNTATHDVKSAEGTAPVERVGSGRVDAVQAVNDDVLVYQSSRPELVSQSFGVVETTGGKQSFQREITVDNTGSAAHTFDVSFAGSTSMPGVSFSFDPTVSVAPGGKKTFTVTATVDTDALVKTKDAGTEEKQLGEIRQYVSTLSGRLVLKENGQELRVPLQIAPKPVSDLKSDSSTIDFPTGKDSADVTVKGKALDRGGWTSALGAFELGAASRRIPTQNLPAASVQGADLQYIGASSTIPSLKAAGKDTSDGMLGFGISTWGTMAALIPSTQFEVSIDTDGNGRADHVVILEREKGLDYPLANLYALNNQGGLGKLLDQQPVNGSWGDRDTNTLDTNAFVLPVNAAKLGISTTDAKKQIAYRLYTGSWLVQGAVDTTDWISYNPVQPDLWFSSSAVFNDVLLRDRADTVQAHRSSSEPAKGLFLHLHNGTGDLSGIVSGEDGGKAEVLSTRTEPKASDGNNGNDARFADVKKGDQFYDEITWLANRNVTTGYPDGTFRPLADVERGAMAAYFYRLAGSPQYTAPSTSPFKDVKPSDQFYKEITWLASQKITTGYADGTFRATAPVNRDAMAAFFYRYAGSPEFSAPSASPFKDLKPSDQFYKEITWLASQKITTGWEDGTFRALSPIHRDAMAAFIFRYDKNVLSKR